MSNMPLPQYTQSAEPAPSHTQVESHAPSSNMLSGVSALRNKVVRLVLCVRRLVYALRWSGRSFLGHTRFLLATKYWSVDLGLAYERLPNGCLIHNRRTSARSSGIEELQLRYPWATTVHKLMYLEGFDKGERFSLHTEDISRTVVCESSVASHFKTCPNNRRRNLDVDMLKRQWYKSQYESPRQPNSSKSG
jgi:hypothetical protein